MSYIKKLREALKVHQQAVREIRHAFDAGPQWYTRGESGLRSQVSMWLARAERASAELESKKP